MEQFLPYAQFLLLIVIALLNVGRKDGARDGDVARLQSDLKEVKTQLADAVTDLRKRHHDLADVMQTHSVTLAVVKTRLGILQHSHDSHSND